MVVCPYHGWSYNLDGCLRGAPAMKKNECFKASDYRLPQFRCEEWLGWIMVTLNPDVAPAAEVYREVEDMIADFQMERYVEILQRGFLWDTNWKVLAENFMESYHLPVCHAGDDRRTVEAQRDGLPAWAEDVQLPHDPEGPSFKIGVAHPSNTVLAGRQAAHHAAAGAVSQPADHADARLFLVPLAHPRGAVRRCRCTSPAACRRISWTNPTRRRTSPR